MGKSLRKVLKTSSHGVKILPIRRNQTIGSKGGDVGFLRCGLGTGGADGIAILLAVFCGGSAIEGGGTGSGSDWQ